MTDFQPITSQEDFDAAIGERLKRERETLAKKYGDYDALKARVPELEAEVAKLSDSAAKANKDMQHHDKIVEELTGKIKSYESASLKTRVAHETGLPYDLAARLSGDDEDALRADAEKLYQLINTSQPASPPKAAEVPVGDASDAGYQALLNSIKEN